MIVLLVAAIISEGALISNGKRPGTPEIAGCATLDPVSRQSQVDIVRYSWNNRGVTYVNLTSMVRLAPGSMGSR